MRGSEGPRTSIPGQPEQQRANERTLTARLLGLEDFLGTVKLLPGESPNAEQNIIFAKDALIKAREHIGAGRLLGAQTELDVAGAALQRSGILSEEAHVRLMNNE